MHTSHASHTARGVAIHSMLHWGSTLVPRAHVLRIAHWGVWVCSRATDLALGVVAHAIWHAAHAAHWHLPLPSSVRVGVRIVSPVWLLCLVRLVLRVRRIWGFPVDLALAFSVATLAFSLLRVGYRLHVLLRVLHVLLTGLVHPLGWHPLRWAPILGVAVCVEWRLWVHHHVWRVRSWHVPRVVWCWLDRSSVAHYVTGLDIRPLYVRARSHRQQHNAQVNIDGGHMQ